MDYKELSWKGYNWITSERWGEIHPDRPWAYYSPNCVSINSDGDLVLDVKPNSDKKSFIIEGGKVIPQSQIGLVSSTKDNPMFKYGDYYWVAKLPKGKHLWPALWMWSWDSWPPEIDVMEAWTTCNGNYRGFFNYDITSNIHYTKEDFNKSVKYDFLKIGLKDPSQDFNTYMLRWLPEKLQFFYNNKLVREFNNLGIMNYLDQSTKGGMNIVMNVMTTADYKDGQMKKIYYYISNKENENEKFIRYNQ